MSRLKLLTLVGFMMLGFLAVPRVALAAGSVSVTAWTCPDQFAPDAGDQADDFAKACATESADLTFALTAGEVTRRRITALGKPASWPSVNGPFTLAIGSPPNEPAIAFCTHGAGQPERFDAIDGKIESSIDQSGDFACQWYRLPALTASPVAASPIPATPIAPTLAPTDTPSPSPTSSPTTSSTSTLAPTATSTSSPTSTPSPIPTSTSTTQPTATSTSTTAPTQTPPPTSTSIPTSTAIPSPTSTATPSPTSTSTQRPTSTPVPTATPTLVATATTQPTSTPGPRALATAISAEIENSDPNYHLDIHVLAYTSDGGLRVYPDPNSRTKDLFTVHDFVVEVTFANPTDDPDGTWDYGVLFGPTASGDSYRAYVTSSGDWFVVLGDKSIRQGHLDDLLTGPRERNTLRLIVSGDRGVLFLNGKLATSFKVEARTGDRTLWLASTNLDINEQAFLDLSVWSFN